jgi:hypothetical protein
LNQVKEQVVSRGRKAAAAVEITPMMPGAGRPEPPVALGEAEARVWRDIVDALPGHWIDPGGGQQILLRLACQSALAEQVEQQIRDLLCDDPVDSKQLAALTVTHTTLAKSIAYLLAQLRATPKSRMQPRDTAARLEPSHREPRTRPWEIRAPDDQIQ